MSHTLKFNEPALQTIIDNRTSENGETYSLEVTHGMRGYFAVMMVTDPDGFREPWATHDDSHETRDGAVEDAIAWAEETGLKTQGL